MTCLLIYIWVQDPKFCTLTITIYCYCNLNLAVRQGFIQEALMFSRWYKKPNLLIKFSNSIFIKFCLKTYWYWTCIQSLSFFYFKLFICPSDAKKNNFFSGDHPPEPPSGLCHESVLKLRAFWDPHVHFATFEKSIFVQKRTLVKPLG